MARLPVQEPVLGAFRARIDEALRKIQRLGRLPVLRAFISGMHEEGITVKHVRHGRLLGLEKPALHHRPSYKKNFLFLFANEPIDDTSAEKRLSF
jgi:hypothetical protein